MGKKSMDKDLLATIMGFSGITDPTDVTLMAQVSADYQILYSPEGLDQGYQSVESGRGNISGSMSVLHKTADRRFHQWKF